MNGTLPNLISWPLGAPSAGHMDYAQGHESIREVLWNLLATRPGERLMRPGFGIGLHNFVHQPNNETTRRLMADAIRKGVTRWEPRIQVEDVQVRPNPEFQDEVSINIFYRLRQDSSPGTFDLTLQLGT